MLSEDQMLQLASDAVQETFASGEEIIRQGDLGSSMFIIESGNVDVTVSDSGSAPTRLAILSSKDVFGEMSLMTGAQRSATVTAMVETRILRIDKPAMSKLLTVEPLLVKRASEYLVGRQVARFEIISQIEKQAPSSTDLFERIKKFFAI
jgi:CRP-like cAMP-binding protein